MLSLFRNITVASRNWVKNPSKAIPLGAHDTWSAHQFAMRLIVFLTLLLAATTAGAADRGKPAFLIPPYLLDVTTDSATVAFQLGAPGSPTVVVETENGPSRYRSGASGQYHFVHIDGLSPAKVYPYRIVLDAADDQSDVYDDEQAIRTATLPGKSFSFAVFGDPRPGDSGTNRNHRDIVQTIGMFDPEFAIILGDMVDDGADHALWQDFFDIEKDLLKRTAVFPVVGDNDVADGKGVYGDHFPRLKNGCYRFEWGGIQFYALNVWGARGGQARSTFDEASDQYRWFIREMEKPESKAAPFRIVFMHDPVKISRGRTSEILKHVWAPAFEKYHVDVAFASWHLYERSHDQGVNYIISGGAGAEIIWLNADPAYPSQAEANVHHFCKVDVSPGAMTIRAIAIDGTVLDAITLTPQNRSRTSENDIALTAKRLQKEIVISPGNGLPQLPLWLFSTDCDFCKRILRRLLPQLAETHQVAFKVHYFDLALEAAYDLFLNAGAEFGRQDADLPAIFIGDSVLGGKSEITGKLPAEIQKFLQNPAEYSHRSIVPFQQTLDTKRLGEDTFNALTFGLILGAGLLDGLNPCAFTTIIFLISYLTLLGASERKIVYTGALFSLSVFVTYLLIGLFFHRSIAWMINHEHFSRGVHLALFLIVVGLAIVSLMDFLNALSGRPDRFVLRLPQTLRQSIENRIRIFADNKTALTLSTMVLGVVISGMELSCTGQVYIPIIAMLAQPQYRITAFSYLVLYNIAFIAPLVTVFVLAFFGKVSAKWNRTQSYRVYIKLGYVVFFGAMIVIMTANGL